MIKFPCEYCGQRVTAADEDVATTAQCPSCNRAVLVPAVSYPPAGSTKTPKTPRGAFKAEKSTHSNMRDIGAALGLVVVVALCLFSVWAEYGLYAWLAAAQLAMVNSYSPKIAMIGTIVLFLLPAGFLYYSAKGRGAALVYTGTLGTAGVIVFFATAYFLWTGDSSASSSSLLDGAKAANYLPHNLTLKASSLQEIALASGYTLRKSRTSTVRYFPVPLPADPAWPALAFLCVEKGSLEYYRENERDLAGTIRYRPLPYGIRRAAPEGTPLFALVFTANESVRSVWIPAAIAFAVIGLYYFKDRPGRKRPNWP